MFAFVTSRAPWIVSSRRTSVPRPRAAVGRREPHGVDQVERPVAGERRRRPHRTGQHDRPVAEAITRWRSQAVSSSVFVPWVTTTPSAPSRVEEAADELDQLREVVVGDRVGAEAAERDLA